MVEVEAAVDMVAERVADMEEMVDVVEMVVDVVK
jgi:hypothetical protein